MTAAARPLMPPSPSRHPGPVAMMARTSAPSFTAIDPEPVALAVATLRNAGFTIHRPLDHAEADAMATLYTRYRDMMLATARRVLGTRSDAEDVVHDVFARLPRLITKYHDHGLGGWLRRVVRNEALMLCRRARARGEVEATDYELAADVPVPPTRDDDLGHAIAQLPLSLREVVVLRHFVVCSHREIAELLEITTAASEVRLCRAIQRLRHTLRPATLLTSSASRGDESSHRRGASSC